MFARDELRSSSNAAGRVVYEPHSSSDAATQFTDTTAPLTHCTLQTSQLVTAGAPVSIMPYASIVSRGTTPAFGRTHASREKCGAHLTERQT